MRQSSPGPLPDDAQKWLQDSSVAISGDAHLDSLDGQQQTNGILAIPAVSAELKGDFTCEAFNDLGTIRKTVKISLTGE